jgi:hypothetical protein
LTHFSPTNHNNGSDNKIRFISPGIEALFNYSLNNSIYFSTGLNYQYTKIYYGEYSSDIKTTTNELSIPFLISLKLLQSTVPDLELSTGFYLGQYVHISNNLVLFENYKKNYAKLFSADDFIGDAYLAIGKKSLFKKIPLGYGLFFRYRLKKHEIVNHEVSRSLYGIKLDINL